MHHDKLLRSYDDNQGAWIAKDIMHSFEERYPGVLNDLQCYLLFALIREAFKMHVKEYKDL